MTINELVIKYKDLYEIKETVNTGLSGNEYVTTTIAFVPSNLEHVLQNDYLQYTRFCQKENKSETVRQYYEAQQKNLSYEISFLKFLEEKGELQKDQIRFFKDSIFELLEKKHVKISSVKERNSDPQLEKEKKKRGWFKSKKHTKQSSIASDPNSAQYILNQYESFVKNKKEFDDEVKKMEEKFKKIR